MKIAFLDASTVTRDDIDFSALEAEGDLTLYPITKPEEATERCSDVEIAISNKVPITATVLEASPNLKLVVSAATGVNQIDLEACKSHGVAVANVAGYSTPSVAQHTFALLLELVTRVGAQTATIREDWPASPIFTRLDYPLEELAGKTFGIVGLGDIGQAVAKIAEAMGMKVIAMARAGADDSLPIPRVPVEDFLSQSDVISLHCPLTSETELFINPSRIQQMKKGAIIINTGRGPLIDEPALADALRSGLIGGAGLDVLSVEPPPADHPLLAEDIPNLVITPHTAWSTHQSRVRLLDGVVADIRAFKNGESLNRIV